MAQSDVLDFLKKNEGHYFTARKIAEHQKINFVSAKRSLNKLAESGVLLERLVRVGKLNKLQRSYAYVAGKQTWDEVKVEIAKRKAAGFDYPVTDIMLLMILEELRVLNTKKRGK